MVPLREARARLAAGELAEVRRLLSGLHREPPSVEVFEALVLRVDAELLSNTRLEAARTLAAARRMARTLERDDLACRARLWSVAAVLLGTGDARPEIAAVRERDLDEAQQTWLDAMEALALAQAGERAAAEALVEQAGRRTALLKGTDALRALPWLARAELALERGARALTVARTGMWLASSLGLRAHHDALARLARGGEAAASPHVQEAVLGLVELASATAGERNLEPLLGQVARTMLELLEVDRAFVVLRTAQGGYRIMAGLGRGGAVQGKPSRSLVESAVRTGLPVVSNDLDRDGSARSASIVSMGLRSVICAPMLHGAQALGVIYGDSERVTEHELKRVAWLARGIAGVAAVAVANAQRLEAAERRTREGREIAHDVRNLLSTVVLSMEDLGEAADLPSWARDVAAHSRGAALRMQQHLDQLLSRQTAPRAVARIDTLVEELAQLLQRSAKARGVRFDLQTVPVELAVQADELGRALTNLMSNALKYAPEGSVVAVRVEEAQGVVRVVVRDQGPGIPENELASIFTSGVQARGAVEGHGLGLGIAARVVRDHGGCIRAENAPGGGARFVVELPT